MTAQATDTPWDNAVPNPLLRQGLFDLGRLVPTVPVNRDDTTPSPFEQAPQPLDAIVFRRAEGTTATLGDWLDGSETNGWLVLHRGRVVTEQYRNGLQPQTRHALLSISKSFIGTLAARLIRQGRLPAAARVADLVPELASGAYRSVMVGQLLDMSSGVAFDAVTADPDSDVNRLGTAAGWRSRTGADAPQSIRAFLGTLTHRAAEPGAVFNYNDADTEVLAWILERVTGIALPELLSREIWSRIGAEQDALIAVDPAGTALASAGLCATLRDLGRFALRYPGSGSPPYEASRACGGPVFDRDAGIDPRPLCGYRNQCWQLEDGIALFGNNGQSVVILPDRQLVCIKLSALPATNALPIFREHTDACRAARAIGATLA